jgi:hypothetical protein
MKGEPPATGDFAGAESLYRRALAIDEIVLGLNHRETQTVREDLGSLNSKSLTLKPEK